MKHIIAFFLIGFLSICPLNTKAQSPFKVYFTYEKCAKNRDFSFVFHDGENVIPAKAIKTDNGYIVTGKLRTQYSYIEILEKKDSLSSYCQRYVISNVPAKIQYVSCDSSSKESYWSDVKLSNAEDWKGYAKDMHESLNDEYESLFKLYRNLSMAHEKEDLMNIEKAQQKLLEKQLSYIKNHLDNYSSLFFLRDIIDQKQDLESGQYLDIFRRFANETQNSNEGKLLLKTILTKQSRFVSKPAVGRNAPNLEAKDINGSIVRLKDFHNKYVLVAFWATWCAPCVKEIPELLQIRAKYDVKKLDIISISLDEDRKKHSAFIKNKKLDWIHILSTKTIISDYYINGIPEMILVDPDGKIVYLSVGNNLDELRNILSLHL
ncbi:MAG: TlpA family protein disulfide reductase [Cytophagales bacterium]|nr:MAG: TlpA family protein disulfide reductase [Cytophagales bacterium]